MLLCNFGVHLSFSIIIILPAIIVRLSTLEKRLAEKMEENGELHSQLKRARDTTQSAISSREEMNKKVAAATKLTQVRCLSVNLSNSYYFSCVLVIPLRKLES